MIKKAIFVAACLFTLIPTFAQTQSEIPVLTVEGGKISGVQAEVPGVSVYKGIPFAAPPVGDLRWKKPQPVIPWIGVRAADTFGPASVQPDHEIGTFYQKEFFFAGDPMRSEDCLYLNVWTPAPASGKKLPVMVWIHGGGYSGGFGFEPEFSGEAFARKGVILVTINYRLGIAGFLAHPLLTAENGGKGSGNYGLYDQLAAVKWVKNNISAFGGDPANITVFGQSAGAGSVQALVSSPLAKGLIHKAIMQSGGGLRPSNSTTPLKTVEEGWKAFFDHFGITSLEQMKSKSEMELMSMYSEYMKVQHNVRPSQRPVIDGELITDDILKVATSGNELDIPYMLGYTTNDITPDIMRTATMGWSLMLEQQGRKPAFVYHFDRPLPGDNAGSFHSSELWYVFGTLAHSWRPFELKDYALSEKMVSYWTNFAKKGDPNAPYLPKWNPCSQKDTAVMHFTTSEILRNKDLAVNKIDSGVYIIETTDMTTMYVVVGEKRALLIDTGTKVDSLDKVVRHITDKPFDVVITHNHVDHAGNIRFFPEVYMHPADSAVRHIPFTGKYNWLTDGQKFDLGGRVMEVRLMPGHTPGSIVLFDPSIHACFTGDAFGSGHVWLQLRPHVPMKDFVKTCDRMAKMMRSQHITKLYCGHYPYVKQTYDLSYILDMKQLAKMIASGKDVQAKPYPVNVDIASKNTLTATYKSATIEYDGNNIN